ncbi:MAG: AAA family ATPase [Carboxydocellales bacterium]
MEIIRGEIASAQKVIVYGPEGIGKSTFASKFPNPVFIDPEDSTKRMDVARTPKPSSWTMLLEQVKYFIKNPNLLDTLVIDTADWAEILSINELCSKSNKTGIEDFGYGKGYVYLAEEFGRLLNMLSELVELGINVVFTAHAQMKKFEQPDEMGAYDRWEMKLQKKTSPLLREWADMVLFANYKTYVVNVDGQGVQKGKNKAQGGKRVMYTTHHNCWDAKNRHGLPEELAFDYAQITHCIPIRVVSEQPQSVPQQVATVVNPEAPKEVQQANVTVAAPDQEPPKQEPPKQEAQPKTQAQPPNPLEGVPKPLADLMAANFVTVKEIQQAVSSRGYYPKNTPIKNYDANFISGVLVGAWEQVFQMIKDFRDKIPF